MMKDGFYAYGQGVSYYFLKLCVIFLAMYPHRSASSSQDSVMTTKKQLWVTLAHNKIKPAITNVSTPKDYLYCYYELNLTLGGGGGGGCLADPLCVSEKLMEQKPKKKKKKQCPDGFYFFKVMI